MKYWILGCEGNFEWLIDNHNRFIWNYFFIEWYNLFIYGRAVINFYSFLPLIKANWSWSWIHEFFCRIIRTLYWLIFFLTFVKIETMKWRARSSDLNPIDHIWNMCGRRLRKPSQSSQENGVEQPLEEVWYNLNPNELYTQTNNNNF